MTFKDITNDIRIGDWVDFGEYGQHYVCNTNYTPEYFWITDQEEDRFKQTLTGWPMRKYEAIEILD